MLKNKLCIELCIAVHRQFLGSFCVTAQQSFICTQQPCLAVYARSMRERSIPRTRRGDLDGHSAVTGTGFGTLSQTDSKALWNDTWWRPSSPPPRRAALRHTLRSGWGWHTALSRSVTVPVQSVPRGAGLRGPPRSGEHHPCAGGCRQRAQLRATLSARWMCAGKATAWLLELGLLGCRLCSYFQKLSNRTTINVR